MAKTYAASDLHGNYELFEAIVAMLDDDDRLYMLGDAADRGLDGYDIITECLDDPRIVYLKGNHDDMFVKAFFYNDERMRDHWLTRCGGIPTATAWIKDGAPRYILDQLDAAPTRLEYVNAHGEKIILTHAGYTPPVVPNDDDLLWDRYHFSDHWGDNPADIYMIHGHTPTECMGYGLYSPAGEACFYCDGHKINLDAGTYHSKKAIVLDLDEFDEIRLDASSGKVNVTTVTHSHPGVSSDKATSSYFATDLDGYWWICDHISRCSHSIECLISEMRSNGITVRRINSPHDVLGYHIVGNLSNNAFGLKGKLSITSAVESATVEDATGDILATTTSGSLYLLPNPLAV